MQPDPTGPGPVGNDTPIQDLDLRAGASSSTNWPSEDAGSIHLGVQGRADSNLTLYFRALFTPEKLSGRVSIFKAGVIPAIDSVPSKTMPFENVDSLTIPYELFEAIDRTGSDTVAFSIRVEIDTAQCLMLDFHYSRKQKNFIKSPFSLISGVSYPLLMPKYSFKGEVDSTILKMGAFAEGKTDWCFYIPGSPYYWKTRMDSVVEIGPVPSGTFPIRLLRLAHPDGDTKKNQLEAYEVILKKVDPDSAHNFKTSYVLILGERRLTTTAPSSFSIR
jgi:hypothetical protein